MNRILFAALVILWVLWVLAFVIRKTRGSRERAATAKISVWGIVLQSVSYAVIWSAGRLGSSEIEPWRTGVFVVFAVAALALIWTAIPALGKQWRLEVGVNVDHELIQTGPYRLLRHPIYASMLALLLSTAALITTPRPFLVAITLFIVGTEIRVRAEDRLLAGRFGERFAEYRRRVRAYVPFVR